MGNTITTANKKSIHTPPGRGILREVPWPHAHLWTEQSGVRPCLGTLYCVLGRDATPTLSLSTQAYKWVLAN